MHTINSDVVFLDGEASAVMSYSSLGDLARLTNELAPDVRAALRSAQRIPAGGRAEPARRSLMATLQLLNRDVAALPGTLARHDAARAQKAAYAVVLTSQNIEDAVHRAYARCPSG